MNWNALQAPFRAQDLSWRIQECGRSAKNGRIWARVFPYVKAHVLESRLDQVLGPESWQSEVADIGGGVACRVGIRTDAGWIWKSAVADRREGGSVAPPLKGAETDAFKRACSHWGIGRYLRDLGEQWAVIREDGSGSQRGRVKNAGAADTPFTWDPPALPLYLREEPEHTARPVAAPATAAPTETVAADGSESALEADILTMLKTDPAFTAEDLQVALNVLPKIESRHGLEQYRKQWQETAKRRALQVAGARS